MHLNSKTGPGVERFKPLDFGSLATDWEVTGSSPASGSLNNYN